MAIKIIGKRIKGRREVVYYGQNNKLLKAGGSGKAKHFRRKK